MFGFLNFRFKNSRRNITGRNFFSPVAHETGEKLRGDVDVGKKLF
jgi:hypothetical protein